MSHTTNLIIIKALCIQCYIELEFFKVFIQSSCENYYMAQGHPYYYYNNMHITENISMI